MGVYSAGEILKSEVHKTAKSYILEKLLIDKLYLVNFTFHEGGWGFS